MLLNGPPCLEFRLCVSAILSDLSAHWLLTLSDLRMLWYPLYSEEN